jgi:hypothetical protein
MIVAQHSSWSLTPSDCAVRLANVGERLQQPVSEPLMISLAAIVGHILGEHVPKRCLPDEDHPIQALFLYGTDKWVRERVQIR